MKELLMEAQTASPNASLLERVEVARDWGRKGIFRVGEFQYSSTEQAPEGAWKGRHGGYEDFFRDANEMRAEFVFLNEFYFDAHELSCARGYLRFLHGDARETLARTIAESESRVGELCNVMITAPCPVFDNRPCTLLMMGDWDPWYDAIRDACDAYVARAAKWRARRSARLTNLNTSALPAGDSGSRDQRWRANALLVRELVRLVSAFRHWMQHRRAQLLWVIPFRRFIGSARLYGLERHEKRAHAS